MLVLRSLTKRMATCALALQVSGLPVGCKSIGASSDVKFGIFGGELAGKVKENSLLSILQRTGGKLNVLVLFFDKDQWVSASKNEVDAAAAEFKKAVETWIAPLQGEDGWNLRQVTLNVRTMAPDDRQTTKTPCSFSTATNFFECSEASDEIRLISVMQEPFRAHANLFGSFLAVQAKGDPKVTLHETGHLIGMADIYEEWRYVKLGEEHDKSMMNQLSEVASLTADDIAGIKQIWRFIRTGKMECPAGYREGGAEKDWNYLSNNTFLCVRQGTLSRKSCSAKALMDPKTEKWGTEPDGTSCYIGPSPARRYPSCSVKVAVNKDGWGMENGQSCWRTLIPTCSNQASLFTYVPEIGVIAGTEKKADHESLCLVMACPSPTQDKAAKLATIYGPSCKDPKGLPVETLTQSNDGSDDGYPPCSNYAVVHKDDPSWGFEPNEVSCHMPTPGSSK